jgi:uncharacterized protein YegP (UPF0339 family)
LEAGARRRKEIKSTARLNGERVKQGGWEVTAWFEVFHDPDEALPYRFRLRAEDGSVVAVSSRLSSICAVKAAIMAVRESAATGLVVDMTGSGPAGKTPAEPAAASPEGRKWATRPPRS